MPEFMPQPTQLLVLDPRQADWQRMVAGAGADTVVLVLNPERDGLAQVAEVAAQYAPLSTLHLPAYGASGSVVLGSAVLDSAGSDNRHGEMAAISKCLSPDGTVHLPGMPGTAVAGRNLAEKLQILLQRRVTGARLRPLPVMKGSGSIGVPASPWVQNEAAVQALHAGTA